MVAFQPVTGPKNLRQVRTVTKPANRVRIFVTLMGSVELRQKGKRALQFALQIADFLHYIWQIETC